MATVSIVERVLTVSVAEPVTVSIVENVVTVEAAGPGLALATAVPLPISLAGGILGTGTKAAKDDHRHEGLASPQMEWPTANVIYGLPGWTINGFSTLVTIAGVLVVPIYVARKTTYDRMAVRVVTGGGNSIGLGVYKAEDNGKGLVPTDLLVDAGNVVSPGSNTFHIFLISPALVLEAGYYFCGGASTAGIPIRSPITTGILTMPAAGEGFESDITGGLGLERMILVGAAPAAPALPDPFGAVGGTVFLATNNAGYGFWLGRTTP